MQKQFKGGKRVFSTNGAKTIIHPYVQAKTEPWLTSHTLYKTYLKMDYGIKSVTIFRKNIRENLQNIGLCKEFLDVTPKAQFIKGKLGKLDFIKIINF